MDERINRPEWKRLRRLLLIGALMIGAALLLSRLLTINSALAAPAPPAPTITSSPPAFTGSTGATFTFTNSQAGVAFECKLDAAAFLACPTPKVYAGLAAGSHTFQVRATDGSKTSGATSYAWTIDSVAPTVTSINRTDASPSKASPLRFTVTFSEAVTGVAGASFGLVTAGLGGTAPTIASVTPASGSATTFTVNVATAGTTGGNGGSTIGLNLTVKSPIQDVAGNALGGSVPIAGQAYAFDTTAPVVDVTKVNGAAVSFPFATNVNVTSIAGTCGAASGDLAPVAWSIGGQSGTATCSAGAWTSASFTISANGSYAATASQSDQAGNSGSSGSKSVTVDKTAPTVSSINRTDPSPTNAGPLHWTVTFNDLVKNVGASNFGLVTTGITGTTPTISSVTPVSGTSATWAVTASTAGAAGSNSGSIGLNMTAKGTIQDGPGNLLGGTVPVVGQAYTFDTTGPAVPSITAGPPLLPDWTTMTNASFSFTGDAGATFLCNLNGSAAGDFTACTSAKSYSGVAQGLNTFYVKAKDAAGNLSTFVSRQWQVDTVDPAAPVFTLVPPDPNDTATSNFDWTPHLPNADVDHYECEKENGSWLACGPPPYTYAVATTNNGQHQFGVRAVDAAGNVSGGIFYSWKVGAGTGQMYTISGTAIGLLYPTSAPTGSPIDLTFNNPNAGNGGSGVNGNQIGNLTVSIVSVVAPNATVGLPCTTADFAVTQFTGVYPFYIPQGTSSLSTLIPAIPSSQWPTIRLVNLPVNQDGCKGATVNLAYTGTP